ncbi:hypothetical protein [Brachybacterium sp. UMB0905]|uniref:hypothetical protein n=1 Tax=Brachybacterium sp. UMB0905 TaxID=2069310 RepID=UPI0011AEC50D|nr:hypothetical protein [Brachybacterium sp. UMB0905]
MSELNRKILVRVPFFILALIFIPTLPYLNHFDALQAVGWILAGALALLAIGMGAGATIERRALSTPDLMATNGKDSRRTRGTPPNLA